MRLKTEPKPMEIIPEDFRSKPIGRTRTSTPAMISMWNDFFFNTTSSLDMIYFILHILTVYQLGCVVKVNPIFLHINRSILIRCSCLYVLILLFDLVLLNLTIDLQLKLIDMRLEVFATIS